MIECKTCGQEKNLYDFYKSNLKQCKACVLAKEKTGREKRREVMDKAIASISEFVPQPSQALYDYAELRPFAGRPGCNDHMAYPSRMGNTLFFKDGSVRDAT